MRGVEAESDVIRFTAMYIREPTLDMIGFTATAPGGLKRVAFRRARPAMHIIVGVKERMIIFQRDALTPPCLKCSIRVFPMHVALEGVPFSCHPHGKFCHIYIARSMGAPAARPRCPRTIFPYKFSRRQNVDSFHSFHIFSFFFSATIIDPDSCQQNVPEAEDRRVASCASHLIPRKIWERGCFISRC